MGKFLPLTLFPTQILISNIMDPMPIFNSNGMFSFCLWHAQETQMPSSIFFFKKWVFKLVGTVVDYSNG